MDPLQLLWLLTATALAVICAYLHAFPQAPYPLHGIMPSLGLVVLAGASVLIVVRSPWLRARTFAPVLLPCALLLWASWRTSSAPVPSEGIPLLGTLLEGSLVFAIALALAAVGGAWRSLSLRGPVGESNRGPVGPGEPDRSSDDTHSLFFHSVLVFFLALAVGMALWALYQYFVLYDQQLVEFRLKQGAKSLADYSPEDWGLFVALRTKRVGSRFGNPNVLAGFLSMVTPLAISAVVLWTDRSAKAAAVGILGLIWYVVLLTGSRGGMLTLLLTTAAGLALLGRATIRKQMIPLAIAVGVCVGAVLLAAITESRAPSSPESETTEPAPRMRYSFFERLRTSQTVAQRLYYLQSGWQMIRLSPWLGHGLGSYAVLYPKYKQPLARETRYPHNILCHLWVEAGLVGLLLWVVWQAVAVVIAVGHLWRTSGGEPAVPVKALLVAVLSFVFNNLLEMTWTFREVYLDWCLLLGVLVGIGFGAVLARGQMESRPKAGPLRFVRGAVALAAVPLLVGVALANSLLLCPMIAESSEITASELLKYGQGREAVEEAMRLAQRMIQYQPNNPWYHHWLACFYRDLGRPQEARLEFEQALRLHPASAAIRADFAGFERKNGNRDKARRLLVEARDLYPRNASYHYLLADLEREVGNRDAAREHIHDALRCVLDGRIKPKYEQFLKNLDERTSAPR